AASALMIHTQGAGTPLPIHSGQAPTHVSDVDRTEEPGDPAAERSEQPSTDCSPENRVPWDTLFGRERQYHPVEAAECRTPGAAERSTAQEDVHASITEVDPSENLENWRHPGGECHDNEGLCSKIDNCVE